MLWIQAMTDSSLNSSVPSTALLSTILPPIPNSSSSSTPNVRTKHRSNDAALIELIRESAAHQQPSTSINFTTGQECGDEQTNRDIADTCCHAGGGNNYGEGNERRADLITRSSNNTSLNTSSVCAISSTSAGNEDGHLKMDMTSGNNTVEQSKDSGCVMFTSNSMSTIANTTDVSVSHSSTSSTENSPVQLHFKQHQIHTDINDTSCNSANLCSSDLQKGEVSSKTPDRNRHLSQSPPNKASRKQPIPSELLNMQSFRVMTERDGLSIIIDEFNYVSSENVLSCFIQSTDQIILVIAKISHRIPAQIPWH
ncbi:hypothetical protein GJ496_001990 [Pomphorhynchus laevis]|nr:hypothetical protein GJ496_001990 [Pomphorhynchus laevis]